MIFRKIMAMLILSCLSAMALANSFSVQYKPVVTQASSHKIEADLRVTNTSTQAVNLATVSIQYYFTKEGTAAMTGMSDYAAILGANYRDITPSVQLTFDATKINIKFAATAGMLPAGQTMHVQFRANTTTWSLLNQTNDPSFNGSITTFTPVTNITVNGGIAPVTLKGVIKNTTGNVLAGAKVKYPGGEATTLADGSFSATANLSGPTPITVSAPGYADLSKIYTPVSGRIPVYANLLKIDKTQIISTNVANTVTTPGGASVTFPPMFDITEQLSVSLTHIRANTRDLLSASGDFSAVTTNGSIVQLSSQGMLDVVIKGVQTGQIYSLANKGPFQIKIPASIPATAPANIPMWYYNTATGKWVEEGSATLINGVYTGNVTHFTTWNMDVPACGGATGVCACIIGTIADPSNDGLQQSHDYTISASGSGWTKSIEATTAQINPNFQLSLLPAGPSTLNVINQTTGWRGSVTRTVEPGPGCTNLQVVDLEPASIMGTVINACTAAPVANATAKLFNLNKQLVATALSDASGTYLFPPVGLVPDVNYSVEITSPNFVTDTINEVMVSNSEVKTLTTSLQVPNDGVNGTLTGAVISAVSGLPLSNTAYEVRAGIDKTTGPVVASGTTNSSGRYSVTLPLGGYTVRAFNSNGSGTANGQSAVCVKNARNIVIGPVLATGMRIIMSWNQGTPNDLDSYLNGPGFRVNYLNKTVAGVANLNIDAAGVNSVEVITLSQETPNSSYVFSVHDYTNRNSTTSQVLSRSGVTVWVERNGKVINEFEIKPNKVGTLWKVFSMVNGVITPIDTMTNQPNTSAI